MILIEKTKISPRQLAKRWGLAHAKILGFIRGGELKAIDVSSVGTARPQFLIDESAIADFERRRDAVKRGKHG